MRVHLKKLAARLVRSIRNSIPLLRIVALIVLIPAAIILVWTGLRADDTGFIHGLGSFL